MYGAEKLRAVKLRPVGHLTAEKLDYQVKVCREIAGTTCRWEKTRSENEAGRVTDDPLLGRRLIRLKRYV